jgi:gentisate 1,2-dioxygenase
MLSHSNLTSERERFTREVAANNLKPLWERSIRLQPGGPTVPAIWRYAEVRSALVRAGELITAHEADRRVLMLENPALSGTTFISTTLFAGVQLVLPGEIVRAHRHTTNALRFIVEGEGAYTTVDGERIPMHGGDFIVTRGWSWHDHGNIGSDPVIWMDGLDTPLAQLFGAHFREDYTSESQPVARIATHAEAKRNHHYPYQRMREELDHLSRRGPPHASHGYRLRYFDSEGGDPIPTLTVFLQWLPASFAGNRYRSTECSVFNVAEGRGEVGIGDSNYAFGEHDVFVVPSWIPYRITAKTDCVLFSYSDRAAQEALGFWREQS